MSATTRARTKPPKRAPLKPDYISIAVKNQPEFRVLSASAGKYNDADAFIDLSVKKSGRKLSETELIKRVRNAFQIDVLLG